MQNKMKTIIFYINTVSGGGAEKVIIQLAHYFANKGFRSVLLTSFVEKNEYPVPSNVERLSIEQEETKQSRLKRNWSRIKFLRQLCKREKPIAVVSFMAAPNFRNICATAGLPVKCILSVRNDPKEEYSGFWGKIVGKFLFRFADGIVFQTSQAKEWFPKNIQKNSAIILNPVQESFYQVKRVSSPRDIVTCGRLNPQKNHAMLIGAFAQIAKDFPNENLLIYGRGELKQNLQKLIENLNLQKRVFLMGTTDKVEEVLSKAKIFVLSSDYEGMPNALMEAMTVGLPCISTDCPCGGPKKLIKDKQNGLLVPCKNEGELALAMEKLLSSKNLAEEIGINARKTAQSFAHPIIFKQWKQYLDSIIVNTNPLKKDKEDAL